LLRLQAGDIIMTGALGQMVPFKPGDHVDATLSGLGSVRTSFSQPW
jgi:2-keto-4-pentenoate hydratase